MTWSEGKSHRGECYKPSKWPGRRRSVARGADRRCSPLARALSPDTPSPPSITTLSPLPPPTDPTPIHQHTYTQPFPHTHTHTAHTHTPQTPISPSPTNPPRAREAASAQRARAPDPARSTNSIITPIPTHLQPHHLIHMDLSSTLTQSQLTHRKEEDQHTQTPPPSRLGATRAKTRRRDSAAGEKFFDRDPCFHQPHNVSGRRAIRWIIDIDIVCGPSCSHTLALARTRPEQTPRPQGSTSYPPSPLPRSTLAASATPPNRCTKL